LSDLHGQVLGKSPLLLPPGFAGETTHFRFILTHRFTVDGGAAQNEDGGQRVAVATSGGSRFVEASSSRLSGVTPPGLIGLIAYLYH
jgi:hypothetical protein